MVQGLNIGEDSLMGCIMTQEMAMLSVIVVWEEQWRAWFMEDGAERDHPRSGHRTVKTPEAREMASS